MLATTLPLGALIDKSYRPRQPADDEVWNLNLDQIEPHSGRVLSKCMLSASELGPSTHAFDRGTVLYSKLRPYLNKVVVADDDGVATTELVPLRCDESRLNALYLAHFLRGLDFPRFATNVVAGAKMPRMVMSEFWKFPVPLPPLPEQRRIAAILDQADTLRAKRREALAQLDSLTQSIFIEMFGDPSLSTPGFPFFALDTLLASPLQNGAYYPKDTYSTDGVEMVHMSDAFNGIVKRGALKRFDCSSQDIAKYRLSDSDILIARRSLTYDGAAKPCRVPASVEPLIFESSFIRISPDPAQLSTEYLFRYLQNERVRQKFVRPFVTQSTISGINQTNLERVFVLVPPLALQQTFATRIRAVESLKATHRAALAELDALFASLQHRAFSGQLS